MNSDKHPSTNQNSSTQPAAGSSLTDTIKMYADKAMAVGHQYYEQAKEQLSHLQHDQTNQAPTQASDDHVGSATHTAGNSTQLPSANTQKTTSNAFDEVDSFNHEASKPASNIDNQASSGYHGTTRSAKKANSNQNQL